MSVVYSELEAFPSAWLRSLVEADLIAPGEVVEGDMRTKLRLGSLVNATQAHFFAGIGVWSYALRLAGWPDDVPVWTGSCPCQPFSTAGKRKGIADDRHLWPDWFELIKYVHPPVVFGEQVASPDGLAWLDSVSTDLEDAGYEVGAADLCAASVGAPHIRQRLYFVAIARGERRQRVGLHLRQRRSLAPEPQAARRGAPSVVGDSGSTRSGRDARGLPCSQGSGESQGEPARYLAHELVPPGATGGAWNDADWIHCRDDKFRPVEPGSFPLAHGAPGRMGRLRAYGNAIVPQVAEQFIRAVVEIL